MCLCVSVANKERPPSAPQKEKTGGEKAAPSKTKGKGKDKGDKGKKDSNSRPPSVNFDPTKPNWTLRFVSDASAAVRCISALFLTFRIKFQEQI